MFRKFQRRGYWKIVFDPEFVSAKKKRKELIQAIINKRTEQKQWTQTQDDQSNSYNDELAPIALEDPDDHNDTNPEYPTQDTHIGTTCDCRRRVI